MASSSEMAVSESDSVSGLVCLVGALAAATILIGSDSESDDSSSLLLLLLESYSELESESDLSVAAAVGDLWAVAWLISHRTFL